MSRGNEAPRDVAYCPHCGNDAPQRLVAVHNPERDDAGDFGYFALVACETCGRPLLYRSLFEKIAITAALAVRFSLKEYKLVWPKAGNLHNSVPQSVRTCYEEAAGIKNRSPNGFANQIRRALEMLCRDRGATKRTLAENLKELSDKGEIPSVLAEMTDVLRMLGNIGSHAAEESVEPEYVWRYRRFLPRGRRICLCRSLPRQRGKDTTRKCQKASRRGGEKIEDGKGGNPAFREHTRETGWRA